MHQHHHHRRAVSPPLLQSQSAAAAAVAAQASSSSHPRTVLQKMREGARKWKGPLVGLVFMRLRRKRSYFIFCLTSPPEIVISSARTITFAHKGTVQ